jgi:hypothetical protein
MPMFALPCESKISHRSRPGAAEFLKWTEVLPAPSGIGRHHFPKKAKLAYSKKLNAKDSCESAKITPGKLTIRYNHPDGTGRFCAKAAPCHKLLKSIL